MRKLALNDEILLKIRNYYILMAWEHGNLKTDTNTYYNITLFLSVNIGRNYWFRGRYQMI